MKDVSDILEWKDFEEGKTKLKTDDRGFAHLLAYTGDKVFPVVYNSVKNVFCCGSLYVKHVKKYAYIPKIRTPKGLKADEFNRRVRLLKDEKKELKKKYFSFAKNEY